MSSEWLNLTNGLIDGYSFHFVKPSGDNVHGISSGEINYSRRLHRVKKPGVNGESLKDFGANSMEIKFEVVFFGKTYQENYLEFEKVVKRGLPMELVVPFYPRPMQVYLQDFLFKSSVSEHNTIRVSVTFIQDEISFSELQASATKVLSDDELFAEISSKASVADEALDGDAFLQAVDSVQNGLTEVRKYSNIVLALDEAAKNKIQTIKSNLKNALSLLDKAVDVLEALNQDGLKRFTSGFLPEEAGRDIIDISESVSTSSSNDEASANSEVSVLDNLQNTNTAPVFDFNDGDDNASIVENLENVRAVLVTDSTSLLSETSGRSNDPVYRIGDIVRLIDTLNARLKEAEKETFLITVNTSLLEVMFNNGVPYTELEAVSKKNRHLMDFINIEPGKVVYL